MVCSRCGTENPSGSKFCSECGSHLASTCPSCGSPVLPEARFCNECGSPLSSAAPSIANDTSPSARSPEAPASERRLVSVLFADLVGFTTLSESRDPEEVRELLTRYFETCRTLIGRYGGTVEKFIGDAVMAVWGTPIAKEDDAERAVRAALELTTVVAALGQEVGAPDLAARAGVLTGEAAVTIGAEGQGMVAGDLVNTASRIQAAAPAGSVFAGEATKRLTDGAVVYEEAGVHELKGKAEPLPLWRALRVVAGMRGAMKSSGLEAPFVGRGRELRLIKELFHASADEKTAHLVSVVGIAGIGKSRLSWEFFKYIDGFAFDVRWHRGRCLPYGEGVTYWALAEMVRTRAGILEGEGSGSALAKLREAVGETVSDPEERRWIEPRLANLLGLEDAPGRDQEGLFAAWRLFYERLSEEMPTVMVFEDLQWADTALLDFVEYLLEWSRDHPIFIITLARPELMDRRPTWGAGRRNFTSLFLESLALPEMEELLAGLVPGLPEELRDQILERAEGVPLYAVETVRMLLDRGLLAQEESAYRPTGPIGTLEVPETLHALIAARLDGLTREERRLVQDAAVLGKSFTKPGIEALTGFPQAELESLLSSLIRKEVIHLQVDARSPERGQYGFLQELLKRVAYDTLSKKERKAKHLAAARFIEQSWEAEEDEIVEVVASHYVEAYRAAPDAPDAGEIGAGACERLARAGERAASLAANAEAQRYFEQAMEFAEEPLARAELSERAGIAATAAGRGSDAERHYEQAIALFEAEGRAHPAARVSARLAEVLWDAGHIEDGIERMERAYGVLAGDEPDEDLAVLTHQLGRMHFFAGDLRACADRVETALEIAERLRIPEVLSHGLNTKSLVLEARGRLEEADALLRRALQVALENDVPSAAFRAYYNLLVTDQIDEVEGSASEGLALARRLGNRQWEANFIGRVAQCQWLSGDWDRAVESERLLLGAGPEVYGFGLSRTLPALAHLHVNRGELEAAERLVAMREIARESVGVIERLDYEVGRAIVARARGDFEDARRLTDDLVAASEKLGTAQETVREGCLEALELALDVGDLDHAEALLAGFVARTSKKEYLRIMLAALRSPDRGGPRRRRAGRRVVRGVGWRPAGIRSSLPPRGRPSPARRAAVRTGPRARSRADARRSSRGVRAAESGPLARSPGKGRHGSGAGLRPLTPSRSRR